MILSYGSKGATVVTLQKQLVKLGFKGKNGKALSTDGSFGEQTEHAVIQFQKKNGLVADGKVGDKTRQALLGDSLDKLLKDVDYINAAQRLGVPELVIRVFGAVEGQGVGFLNNGKAKILFERHRMYEYLKQFKSETFAKNQMKLVPNLVNTKTGGYQGNEAEYVRLTRARQIHEVAALQSTSWGQFQIMGENWKALGYSSVQEFVEQMQSSESCQLEAFIRFIEWKPGLLEALKKQDWDTVFTLYNGKNYKKLGYQAKFQAEWDHLEPIYRGEKAA
ncbi:MULTISPECIES: N-acetylmuramidase domain-containing protein [unclassified Acinetobacter]|uniref:N-acetylmuramidase domain-containing protein n=1 Tax=unclassified Acinetobacter TaxID=196816 RepID=UPI00190B1A3B|nr:MULTISPECIES: N-acetylmuramidase family protein [unclassified Acinetobacter]MBK0062623.1 N-acetylmuramidase family protein [Acinetobacter sp. S55]MBK0065800.1 N-acetylmuramidase family protein [Acinetobacter sp. S54]